MLADVEIFARCKKRDIRALAKACEERAYARGEALFLQGQRGVALFVVTAGTVRVEQLIDDGRVVTVATLGAGAVVGEMAILDGAERTASVVADTDVECLVLTSWDFKAMLRARPVVALDILPVVVGRFRRTAAKLRGTPGGVVDLT